MSLLKAKNENRVPPDGWRCICPGTTTFVRGSHLAELSELCAKALTDQGKPLPPDLDWQVEHAACIELPPGWCVMREPSKSPVSWPGVKRFITSMVKWGLHGFRYVPLEEAERRGRICVQCPYNVKAMGMCGGCQNMEGEVARLLDGRKTRWDSELHNCGVCLCFNRVQIWFHVDDLAKVSGGTHPEWCWKNG